MSIYKKLLEIQQNLKAPKGQYNDFGKYAYRSCEDVLEAVKPWLVSLQAVLTISDRLTQAGDRYYIEATATLVDAESGESVSVTGWAREEEHKKGMDGSQITGASSSYARKYALNGLFCIDDNRDSDSTNDAEKPGKQPKNAAENKPTTNKPTPVPKFTCSQCKQEIQPITNKGRTLSPAEIADGSTKTYGRALCYKCSQLEKLRLSSNENS